jgi:hypothetical protein
MGARAIQIVAVFVAVACLALAGRLQQPLVDLASEQYLSVLVAPAEGGSAFEKRVPLSRIRSVETRENAKAGESIAFRYQGEIRSWEGKAGDTVRVSFDTPSGSESVEGRVRSVAGYGLRYTDEAQAGAPPIIVLGTALGALRGLIVDYLWLKVTIQKEKGLLYEVMADSTWPTTSR